MPPAGGRCKMWSHKVLLSRRFFSMQKGNLSRRGFMQRSVAALAAAGLPAWYAKEVFGTQAAQEANKAAQSDRIIMGAIGIGPRPRRCLDLYNAARQNKSVAFAAACNVD